MKEEEHINSKPSKLWSSHSFSKFNKKYSQFLPFRPEPINGESLYSWIIRISRANYGTINTIFKTRNKGLTRLHNIDYMWYDDFMEVVSKKTGYNILELKEFHVSKWNHLFTEEDLKARKIYSTSVKFCPYCLKENATPHFKLEYRLNLLNMCDSHKAIVLNKCPKCNSEIRPHQLPYDIPLCYCYKCGFNLREAKTVLVESTFSHTDEMGNKTIFYGGNDLYYEQNDEIRTILYENGTPYLIKKLKVKPQEYFSIIFIMATFMIHAYNIERYPEFFPNIKTIPDYLTIYADQLKRDWKELKSHFKFFQNPLLANAIISSCIWHLHNEVQLFRLIGANQNIFNKIFQNNLNIPKYLRKFINVNNPVPRIMKDEFLAILEKMEKSGKKINFDSVAKELGVRKELFFERYRNEFYRNLILEKLGININEIETQFKQLIGKQQKLGDKILKKTIADKIGIDPFLISIIPELSKYFKKKQEMNPTYISRINNTIEEIKQEKIKITKAEIAKRAKIATTTINKYSALKKLVEKAIKTQKKL